MSKEPALPMTYPDLPRQGESTGYAWIRFPLPELLDQFVVWFAMTAFKALLRGAPLHDASDLLERVSLGPTTATLDAWFPPSRETSFAMQTAEDLRKTASQAESLADAGSWRDREEHFQMLAADAQIDLEERIEELISLTMHEHGPTHVPSALRSVREQFQYARRKISANRVTFPSRSAEQLRKIARVMREASAPQKKTWKLALRWKPKLSPSWWLSKEQWRTIQQSYVSVLKRAQQARESQLRRATKEKVYAHFLGEHGLPGLLDQRIQESQEQCQALERLSEGRRPQPLPPLPPGSTEIRLADSIETRLSSHTQTRVGTVMLRRAGWAGRTPEGLADQIRQHGLRIGSRHVLSSQFGQVEVSDLREALIQCARAYLGVNERAPLNWDNPRTALDHIAGLHLMSEELSDLLDGAIQVLIDRSRPYYEMQVIKDHGPRSLGYLLCYPEHRQALSHLLIGVTIADPGNEVGSFSLADPYRACVLRCDIGVALGSLRRLDEWTQHATRLHAAGREELFDPPIEHRVLQERPEDSACNAEIFEAAVKAGVVIPITGESETRFTLAHPDPSIDSLLIPTEIIARDLSEHDLALAVRKEKVIRALVRLFAHLTELTEILARLAVEDDPQIVALELLRLGVVAQPLPNLYRVQASSSSDVETPDELFLRRPAKAKMGLTRGAFCSLLETNDQLFTILVYRLVDAVIERRISRNEVPAFVRDRVKVL